MNSSSTWAIFGKQNWWWGMNLALGKVLECSLMWHCKGCWFILSAERWSWKLKSAKECVRTHLPKGQAPKMDGAEAGHWCPSIVAMSGKLWAWGHGGCSAAHSWARVKELPVQVLVVVAIFQKRVFEDRRGEGFHANSRWTWVSQSWAPIHSFAAWSSRYEFTSASPPERKTVAGELNWDCVHNPLHKITTGELLV